MDIRYLKIMTVRADLSARSSMTSRNGTYTTDRRATGWQTGNSTRRFSRYGGITASAKTWRIFTTTTRTGG
ncbi:hypothetical protein FNJ09_22845, partial [Salmonella enterica subsp. salamae]|nr:hypothetical protein [Salmonella enterica subsp. salamae]